MASEISPVVISISNEEGMNLLHYGLQRSGTNFLETLLKKNYRVRFLNSNKDRSAPIQKHFRLYDNKDIIPEPQYHNEILVQDFSQFESLFKVTPEFYLVISKDPYSWYLSYENWARKCNWPEVKHHYIEEYNLFYGKFLEFSSQSDRIIFVRYVDLVKDANSVLRQLEARMQLSKKLLARISFKLPGRVSQSSNFTDEKRAYYLEEKYLQQFNGEKLQQLNHHIEDRVIELLGYTKVELAK